MTDGTTALLVELRASGEKLDAPLRERIVAAGAPVVPVLIEVLLEDEPDDDDEVDGWASIHAVGLLVDLKAEAAIGPMLRVLAETDWDHIIHDRIILRLPELGASVLEPALSMLGQGPPDHVAESLCAILSQLGVRDERVFEQLVSRFPACPEMASGWLADYGDPRGLARIEDGMRLFDPHADPEIGPVLLRDFVEAYERLGGPLPDELRAHVDLRTALWRAERTASPPAAAVATSAKIGRNDPCPCGSGKKYKRCHLATEGGGGF